MFNFHLVNWITNHPGFGGLIAFIISFAESLAVVGLVIPGSVTMTAIGVLVGSGLVPISSALIFGILGAILGDGISYLIGYYFKNNIATYWPFRRYPKILISGEYFIKQHGSLSIFLGRFIGPIRATVPLIAGIMNMPIKKYLFASIPAAILWAPTYMLPGFLLGAASLELPTNFAIGLIIFVMIGLVLLWIKAKLLFYLYDKSRMQYHNFFNRKWGKWCCGEKTKWFCCLLQINGNIKHTGQLFFCFLSLLSFILFLALFLAIKFHVAFIINWNTAVYHLINSIRFAKLDIIMIIITTLAYKYVLLITILALIIFFCAQKKYFISAHFVAMSIITSAAIFFFKFIYYSPRPNSFGLPDHALSSSFPSGHTTFAIVFYGFLFFILAKQVKPRLKTMLHYFLCFIVLIVGFSRIYLNAHWLSDVVGAILLGFSILMALIISYNRLIPVGVNLGKTVIVTIVTLALSLLLAVHKDLQTQLKLSEPYLKILNVNEDIWWNQDKNDFAVLIRNDRLGKPYEPLNVEWLGSMRQIKILLRKYDWQNTTTRDYLTTIKNVATQSKVQQQSIFDKLYLDKHPVLDMTKIDKDRLYRLHLVLWRSGIIIMPQNKTLWVGLLTQEYTQKYLFFFKHNINKTATFGNIILLQQSIASNWQTKIITKNISSVLKNKYPKTQLILIRGLNNAKK